MSLFLFTLQSYQFRQVELICYWLILFRAVHLLWFRDFLDHDSCDRLVPGVGVKTSPNPGQSPTATPTRTVPDLIPSQYPTIIFPNGVNTFDGSWFSALIAVESEIPTFTTPLATGYSKIAVELYFQDGV